MNKRTPLISVIVPCFNQAQFLDESLQSVLYQSFTDWECIVISDGSTDNTEEIANKWIKKDSRFYFYFQENGGPSAARNFGITNAKGKWILPLDADNYIDLNYLKKAHEYFDIATLKIIHVDIMKFDKINGIWKLPEFSLRALAHLNMIENGSLFKKDDWKLVGGYDESLVHGLEDWEFWISLLKNGGKVFKINEKLLYYRVREKSRSTSLLQNNKLDETLKYIEKKHFDFFYENLGSKISLYNENSSLRGRFHSKYYLWYNKIIDLILKIKND